MQGTLFILWSRQQTIYVGLEVKTIHISSEIY